MREGTDVDLLRLERSKSRIKRTRITSVLLLGGVLVVSMASVGCASDPNDNTRSMIEATPVNVEAEQVVLAPGEVDCGVRAELWDAPSAQNQGGAICKLLPAGKALHFDDDVVYSDPAYRSPYVQVRGTFPLGVLEITSTKDGPEKNTKLVELKVGIKVNNPCFPNPLPIMGVRKSQFTQDFPPLMLFRVD